MADEKKPSCVHPDFDSEIKIGRLFKGDDHGGMPDDFMFHAEVKCKVCGIPMLFLGIKEGLAFNRPMVSVDWTELRAPIAPQDKVATNLDQFASAVRKGTGNLH